MIIECPRCGTHFTSEDLPGGTSVQCTQCHEVFVTRWARRWEPDTGLLADAPHRQRPQSDHLSDQLEETSQREPGRRWFASSQLEVIVWLDGTNAPRAFRLCYRTPGGERAVTWSDGKLTHARIDAGERHDGLPSYKQSPMLAPDIEFDGAALLERFERASGALPGDLARFIHSVLSRFDVPRG